jgi:hypothetical protein
MLSHITFKKFTPIDNMVVSKYVGYVSINVLNDFMGHNWLERALLESFVVVL